MWVNKKNILSSCCELAICKLKKCTCISCVVPINDCYLQQHQLFFQISRLVLNVTSSCLQPHYADRPFSFFFLFFCSRVNLFPCAVFQYFLHPLSVWLGDMATVLSATILHCQEAHRVTWKKLSQMFTSFKIQ